MEKVSLNQNLNHDFKDNTLNTVRGPLENRPIVGV